MIRTVRALAVVAAVLVLVACTDADLGREARPNTLANTSWRAFTVNGTATAPNAAPTALFKLTEVSGTAGCNHYSGGYDYDAGSGKITFHELAMTAMACLEAAKNDVEAAFTKALLQVDTASIDPAGQLVLSGPNVELVFEVAPVPV
jgi:heat shock protein HslJ